MNIANLMSQIRRSNVRRNELKEIILSLPESGRQESNEVESAIRKTLRLFGRLQRSEFLVFLKGTLKSLTAYTLSSKAQQNH